MKIYRYNKKSYFDNGVEVETLPQWEEGIVMHPLKEYIKMKNDLRADRNEGVAYFMQGKNNESIGTVSVTSKKDGQTLEFKMSYFKHSQDEFKNIDKIFVACFSKKYSKELCKKFEADDVLEGEVDEKITAFERVFQINGKDTRIQFWQGIVDYKDKTKIEQGTYKDSDDFIKKTLFTKCEKFEDEEEFRIVLDSSPFFNSSQSSDILPEDCVLTLPFAFTSVKEWKVLPSLQPRKITKLDI